MSYHAIGTLPQRLKAIASGCRSMGLQLDLVAPGKIVRSRMGRAVSCPDSMDDRYL